MPMLCGLPINRNCLVIIVGLTTIGFAAGCVSNNTVGLAVAHDGARIAVLEDTIRSVPQITDATVVSLKPIVRIRDIKQSSFPKVGSYSFGTAWFPGSTAYSLDCRWAPSSDILGVRIFGALWFINSKTRELARFNDVPEGYLISEFAWTGPEEGVIALYRPREGFSPNPWDVEASEIRVHRFHLRHPDIAVAHKAALADAAHGFRLVLPRHDVGTRGISPDGRKYIYAEEHSQADALFKVIELKTGHVTEISFRGHLDSVWWNTGERCLVTSTLPEGVFLLTTGSVHALDITEWIAAITGSRKIISAQWLPDQRSLIVRSGSWKWWLLSPDLKIGICLDECMNEEIGTAGTYHFGVAPHGWKVLVNFVPQHGADFKSRVGVFVIEPDVKGRLSLTKPHWVQRGEFARAWMPDLSAVIGWDRKGEFLIQPVE